MLFFVDPGLYTNTITTYIIECIFKIIEAIVTTKMLFILEHTLFNYTLIDFIFVFHRKFTIRHVQCLAQHFPQ